MKRRKPLVYYMVVWEDDVGIKTRSTLFPRKADANTYRHTTGGPKWGTSRIVKLVEERVLRNAGATRGARKP